MCPLDRVLTYKYGVQSQNANKPPEGSMPHLILMYMNLLNLRATCGSTEQPLPSPIGKALNQPKPRPSDRTV